MGIVELREVSKRYDGRTVVADISLRVDEAERLVILGPSGCGKTTLLRMVAGFIAPDEGEILLDGGVVASRGTVLKEPEERNLGMVFQDLALWPHLSVLGNMELGLKARSISALERATRVRHVLDLVEMGDFSKARPAQLSGGQQQRLALARALVLEPRVLLMDEPLSNLDLVLNMKLRREITRLQEALRFTLIYITHDYEEALAVGTRIVMMREGRIELVGRDDEVRAYLSRVTHPE